VPCKEVNMGLTGCRCTY